MPLIDLGLRQSLGAPLRGRACRGCKGKRKMEEEESA